jgi:cytochrome P450
MEQRKLLLPPLHGKRMQRYGELMGEIAAAEIERWPSGEPYPLRPRMQAITLEIILRTVFGLEYGERLEQLRVELRRLLDVLTRPEMFLFPVLLGPERLAHFGPFRRLHEQVDELIYAEIADRRKAPDLAQREDILSMLLMARHDAADDSGAARSGEAGGRAGGKPEGSPMTDREIRDELVTLLVAGHETTATALSWAVERLTRHPEKLARLTEEVRAGEDEYLEAVVTETLRLRPVISLVARYLRAPVEIGAWQLPAGVTIAPSIYLVHRRPDVYPNPERFEPERFLENKQPDDPGAAQSGEAGSRAGGKPGTYTWIPFGGGVRRCIGGSFAHFEMQVVLSELVKRRGLAPARAESEPVFRRAITETPRHDAEVVLA